MVVIGVGYETMMDDTNRNFGTNSFGSRDDSPIAELIMLLDLLAEDTSPSSHLPSTMTCSSSWLTGR